MNLSTFSRSALTALALLGAATVPAAHAADVGVTIEVSQPGVYGRVDIGRFPQPQVIVPQPVIIAAPPVMVARPQPVYLWVPPGHRKDWGRHCSRYSACGVPVYFVRHDWYRAHVHDGVGQPGSQRVKEGRKGGKDDRGQSPGKGHGNGQGKGRGRD